MNQGIQIVIKWADPSFPKAVPLLAKEALIVAARDAGASFADLVAIVGLDSSNISRRYDPAKVRYAVKPELLYAKTAVEKEYLSRSQNRRSDRGFCSRHPFFVP